MERDYALNKAWCDSRTSILEAMQCKLYSFRISGHLELITKKHPRPGQDNDNDYQVYRSLVAQIKIKSFQNRTDGARPQWKWKYMLKKMVIP